ncbi:hypothetical protein ACDX78_03480 [Virgibacillus oceani]
MHLIAKQPYVKVERKVSSIEQWDEEEQRMIYLYDEKVVTKRREFPITDVLDVSYKEVAGTGGILYLHTLKGVFPYTVKDSPKQFILAFNNEIKEKGKNL